MPNATKSKTTRNRNQARQLQASGRDLDQIAAELGVGVNTVRTWLPRKNAPKADSVRGLLLIEFLESVGFEDPQRGFLVNNREAGASLTRAIHRWRHEAVNPGLEKAENALCYFGLMFSEFEEWADQAGAIIWASGSAPSWWNDDSDSRLLDDLDSLDSEWRAEARVDGIANGMLTRAGHRRVLSRKHSPYPSKPRRVAVAA